MVALQPVSFVYNEGDGRTRYGFIAEDTAEVDDHLATYDAEGQISGIDDRALLSIVVQAIKQIAAKVSETAHLVIDTLSAHLVRGDRGEFGQLCVGSTCVTEDQFIAVFGSSATTQTAAAAAADTHTHAASDGSSATGSPNTDNATTTTPSGDAPTTEAASTTPPAPSNALDSGTDSEATADAPDADSSASGAGETTDTTTTSTPDSTDDFEGGTSNEPAADANNDLAAADDQTDTEPAAEEPAPSEPEPTPEPATNDPSPPTEQPTAELPATGTE